MEVCLVREQGTITNKSSRLTRGSPRKQAKSAIRRVVKRSDVASTPEPEPEHHCNGARPLSTSSPSANTTRSLHSGPARRKPSATSKPSTHPVVLGHRQTDSIMVHDSDSELDSQIMKRQSSTPSGSDNAERIESLAKRPRLRGPGESGRV